MKDLTGPARAWYFRSTPVWLAVMAVGSVLFLRAQRPLRQGGVDVDAAFGALPRE